MGMCAQYASGKELLVGMGRPKLGTLITRSRAGRGIKSTSVNGVYCQLLLIPFTV